MCKTEANARGNLKRLSFLQGIYFREISQLRKNKIGIFVFTPYISRITAFYVYYFLEADNAYLT
jgi:hypothetical protein